MCLFEGRGQVGAAGAELLRLGVWHVGGQQGNRVVGARQRLKEDLVRKRDRSVPAI